MQALTLFNQNFAIVESLLQLYQMFSGLEKRGLNDNVRLALCSFWEAPENTALHHAHNDRVAVIARAGTPLPEALIMEGGLDFLLRQAVVVACTALESFFWDVLQENVLTIVRARKSNADEAITSIQIKLGDYISIENYKDPDYRLKKIILMNFKKGILYNEKSIDQVAKILTIKNFWEEIEKITGEKAKNIKRPISELIARRNQVAHRADRPDEDEKETADQLGLRPITYAWTHQRVQTAKTLVTASVDLFKRVIKRLENDIRTAEEQAEAHRLQNKIEEKKRERE